MSQVHISIAYDPCQSWAKMPAMKMLFSPMLKMLESFKYPALSDSLDMDFMIFVVCAWVLSNLGSF